MGTEIRWIVMTIYRQRKLNRLKKYDYSIPGWYLVTVCTHHQKTIFGSIKVGHLKLTNVGEVVDQSIRKISQFYPHIIVDEYVIMPNHFHLILDIIDFHTRTEQCSVPTIQRTYGEVSKSVQSLKGVISKEVKRKKLFSGKIWQRSFHDHIILNEKELERIREYVAINPYNWKKDEEWVG